MSEVNKENTAKTETKIVGGDIPLKDRKFGCFWIREELGRKRLSGRMEINGKKLNFFGLKNISKNEEHASSPDYDLFFHSDTYKILSSVGLDKVKEPEVEDDGL